MTTKKIRADQLVAKVFQLESREVAQKYILAGKVLVNDHPITKAGTKISPESQLRIKNEEHHYVSRGALKLLQAFESFHIEINEGIGLDIGASTGGFSEVLLEKGAKKVFAIDVGQNQLAWKIRSDSRVQVLENQNARFLDWSHIGVWPDIIVVDVSFISLTKIFSTLISLSKKDTNWVTLLKPQFELKPEQVEKGGIIRSENMRKKAIHSVLESAKSHGLE